jgi:hypothetical protein
VITGAAAGLPAELATQPLIITTTAAATMAQRSGSAGEDRCSVNGNADDLATNSFGSYRTSDHAADVVRGQRVAGTAVRPPLVAVQPAMLSACWPINCC